MANFYRYQAYGNDILVIDPAEFPMSITPPIARLLCDRHFGLGADGICYGPLGAGPPFSMRFINPDGSDAEKSGNGLRVFARYLWDKRYVKEHHFPLAIGEEISYASILDEKARSIRIGMGRISFLSDDIPATGETREMLNETLEVNGEQYTFTAANIGNPHCLIFGQKADKEIVQRYGPLIEYHPMFPKRINVHFVDVLDEHHIRMAIWERGAGYTLASGSSASAAAGAAVRLGYCRNPVNVHMDGGTVQVTIDEDWQITLTGTVEPIASGQLAPDFIEHLRNMR
ncbi:MAG: diaminopimelate epimerase [Chloroflexi bacterium]|nr:MAG: diaminopimelate epimerase [Chloroflexota bacterium]